MNIIQHPSNTQRAQAMTSGEQVIRLKGLLDMTALSRSSVYRLMASDASFPKPFKIGYSDARNSAIGFLRSDIERWISQQVKQRAPLQ